MPVIEPALAVRPIFDRQNPYSACSSTFIFDITKRRRRSHSHNAVRAHRFVRSGTDGVPVLAVCLLRFNNRNPKLCGLFEEGTKQWLITTIRVFSNSKSLTAAIHF